MLRKFPEDARPFIFSPFHRNVTFPFRRCEIYVLVCEASLFHTHSNETERYVHWASHYPFRIRLRGSLLGAFQSNALHRLSGEPCAGPDLILHCAPSYRFPSKCNQLNRLNNPSPHHPQSS